MVFSSLVFISYFLPAVLVIYYLVDNRSWRNIILLLASLFFYSWGEPTYILLMLASIVINWKLALGIRSNLKYRNSLLICGLAINLLCIGVFKYSNFIIGNINNSLSLNIHFSEIALPIGISFYTFQAISYLVDVHRGSVLPQRNFLFFGTYLSMFPQLIAGPIVRYETIEKEIIHRNESLNNFYDGLIRFIVGFSKKVLIANTMGNIADRILFQDPASVGAIGAWYGFVAYTFQIYFDFSGYSDMAIGLGRMFGFHFLENFNYPYISKSITEFWRRWHISLSSFFRDYVYIPMGGNRVKSFQWAFNIILVWSLTGLWHGASWNFVIWGFYYGMLLIGEKILWGKIINRTPIPFQYLYTFLLIVFGWVIFRIEDLPTIIDWMLTLFGFNGFGTFLFLNMSGVLQFFPWFFIALICSTPIAAKLLWLFKSSFYRNLMYHSYFIILLLISIMKLSVAGFNPFIYFRF